jgi:16S rRNA (cytidine1402-2'-O)-methyltransferase
VPGTLVVIGTPLGNLDDLSPRALDALRNADCVACEDTRRTAKLLARFDVRVPTVSCHKFNERQRIEPLLGRLRDGQTVALVADGGTPGVSDPGARLVAAAHAESIAVTPIPGPSAVTALLSASGFVADRFVFDGFLPQRAGERRQRLRDLAAEPRPIALFESPHRIRQALEDMAEILGDRAIVLGRELTKQHETLLRGTASELRDALGKAPVRGEITLVVGPLAESGDRAARSDAASSGVVAAWHEALARAEGDRRKAFRDTARRSGLGRDELYRRLAEAGIDPGGRTRRPGRPGRAG